MTISAWVYLDGTQIDNARIICKEWGASSPWISYFITAGHNQKIEFGMTGPLGGDSAFIASPDTHSHYTWLHITGITSPSGTKLYINGALAAENLTYTTGGNGSTEYSSWPFNIGGNKNRNQEYFKGIIDDIRIFNRALSATEIGELYHTNGWDTNAKPALFAKLFNGGSEFFIKDFCVLSNNEILAAGGTSAFGYGSWDGFLMKLNGNGDILWQKAFGKSANDQFIKVTATSDGGFIAAGLTESWGAGSWDIWIVKYDGSGNIAWQKTFGGTGAEGYYYGGILETAEGDYIVSTVCNSFGKASGAYVVMKLDQSGSILWQKQFQFATDNYSPWGMCLTSDGGCLVAGNDQNPSPLILNLDASGNIVWQKTYGGYGNDSVRSIAKTPDGGYIVTCDSMINNSSWIMKLDNGGDIVWQKYYQDNGQFLSIQALQGGRYMVAGSSELKNFGNYLYQNGNALLLNLDSDGNIRWQKEYLHDQIERSTKGYLASDGSFLFAGMTHVPATGSFLFKTDSNGNFPGASFVSNAALTPSNTYFTASDASITPTNITVGTNDSDCSITPFNCTVTTVYYTNN